MSSSDYNQGKGCHVLLGAGSLLEEALKAYHKVGIVPHTIADPSLHERWATPGRTTSWATIESLSTSATSLKAKNTQKLEEHLKELGATSCLVTGWPVVLPSFIVGLLEGSFFNCHLGLLPEFRGAATNSWLLLNQSQKIGTTIHRLTAKLDAGPILFSDSADRKPDWTSPDRLSVETLRLASSTTLPKFARALALDNLPPDQPQPPGDSLYFPRLSTPINGFIDFRWTAEEVISFVQAFSTPYPGARFRCNDVLYTCTQARLIGNSRYHSFCSGLVAEVQNPSSLSVLTSTGIVELENVSPVSEQHHDQKIREGDRLYSREDELLHARVHRPGRCPLCPE